MVQVNHSGLLEDNRFIEVTPFSRNLVHPHLDWHCDQEDYLCDEMVGFYQSEINYLRALSEEAFRLFEQATDHIINNKNLGCIDIPDSIHDLISYTWRLKEEKHRFIYGRFDIIGGLNGLPGKIIEFNADTCTMVPETFYWQELQRSKAGKRMSDFNFLQNDMIASLLKFRREWSTEPPIILGSSLGHPDDDSNIRSIIDEVSKTMQFTTSVSDLKNILFSDDGAFIQDGEDYIPIDILLKLFPWDWIYTEEKELQQILAKLIMDEKLVVLNPPFTTIWQNKKFLNYITEYFPNNIIAKSYDNPTRLSNYVVKSSHGRLGEEVTVKGDKTKHSTSTYQEFLDLPKDNEGNYYQIGMFFTTRSSALNVRCQDSSIITEDCEFYSHFILN